jgi:hypothetical protein
VTGTGGEGEGGGATALVQTDEVFLHTVESQNVIEADAELWRTFEKFLGGDPSAAWALVDVTHQPAQVLDGDGNPTGEWKLVSSARWRRDPDAPSPIRALVIADERPVLEELVKR